MPRPDPVMGEIGVAVVVPRRPASARCRSTSCAASAPAGCRRHKLPEALRLVDALPLTPMQKVDRRALAARERDAPGTGVD